MLYSFIFALKQNVSYQKEVLLTFQKNWLTYIFRFIWESVVILLIPTIITFFFHIFNWDLCLCNIERTVYILCLFESIFYRIIILQTRNSSQYFKIMLFIELFDWNLKLKFLLLVIIFVSTLNHKGCKGQFILPFFSKILINILISKNSSYNSFSELFLYIKILFIFIPHLNLQIINEVKNQAKYLDFSSININPKKTEERDKDSILSSIIHDLRNPINVINSILTVLLDSSNINSEQREHIESALFSCHFQLTIVNNILDINKIQANKFQIMRSEFSLPNLIQNILKMQEKISNKKGIKLQPKIENTLPEFTIGDKNRICQILLNIIGNSIKFTNEGQVFFQAKWINSWSDANFSIDSMRQCIEGASASGEIDPLLISEFKSCEESKRLIRNPKSYEDNIHSDATICKKMENYSPLKKFEIDFGSSNSIHNHTSSLRMKNIENIQTNKKNKKYDKSNFLKFATCNYKNKIKFIDFSKLFSEDENIKEGLLFVEISDTGEGIKPEEQPKLFQAYFQGSSTMKAQGTGLGLWITQQLIEMMRGKIKLYSVYGRGTCIRICIPLTISNYPDKKLSNISLNLLEGGRISPIAPRHNINIRRSNFQVYILFDNLFLLRQVEAIKSNLQTMKLNLDINHYDFNQNLNFFHFNSISLVIIICSFNSLRALDIIKELKAIETDFHSKLISFAVFNSHCIGLEDVLRGYVDFCNEFSIQNTESYILKYAQSKLKTVNKEFNSFEESCKIAKPDFMNIHLDKSNSTIMIADDDFFSRSSLVYMMKYNGYCNIIEVGNGEEAVNLYKRLFGSIKLIFLDKRMPKLDGILACRSIRSIEKERSVPEIPIIGLTGDKDNTDFNQAGATVVVEKPISQTQLQLFLQTML